MTASESNSATSDNSGVRPDSVDTQTILRLIRQRGGATVEGLAKRTGLTEAELRWQLIDLREQDRIDVHTGLRAVRITPTDRASTVTDDD